MILTDTSVWIDHFRRGNPELVDRLLGGEVLSHPLVLGELACGSFKNRSEILRLLRDLPQAPTAETEEVMDLLERRHLWGKGLGWIDVHLIASALLSHSRLWTLDKRLAQAAVNLGLAP